MVVQPRLTYQVWVVVGLVVTVVIAALGSALGSGLPRVVIAVITVGLGAVLGRLATGRRADSRPSIGNERDDDAAVQRDRSAERRDLDFIRRDEETDGRDRAGAQRDAAGDRRDLAAGRRDVASERRDDVDAHHRSGSQAGIAMADEASAGDRRAAASDRGQASEDRRAGAVERAQAERDRTTASADRAASAHARTRADTDRSTASGDRGASADERGQAEQDRVAAFDDRGASAREREYSSVDGLIGVHVRSAGFLELGQKVDRAGKSGEPLVLAVIDVDHLKDINDSGGHDAGDRILLAVATTLAAQLRSHDLIFRYGGDAFVCALAGVTIQDVGERLALANDALAGGPEHASVTAGLVDLRPGESADDLVARADAALLRKRRQGRPPPGAAGP